MNDVDLEICKTISPQKHPSERIEVRVNRNN